MSGMGVRQRGFVVAVLLLVGVCSGCASSGAPAAEQRKVPPPVADHSVDPDADAAAALRAHVDVTFEAERPGMVRTDGVAQLVATAGERCYRLALQVDRTLEGRMLYELLVTSNGRVAGVEKVSASAASRRLAGCMESVLARLRFRVAPSRDPIASRLYVLLELRRELVEPGRSPLEGSPDRR